MMIHVMTTHDTLSPLYKLPLQVKSIGVRTGKKSWYWIDTKSAVSHSINKDLGFQIQTAYKWKKILISVLQELFINKDRQLRRSQNKTWVTWKHLKPARKKTLFSKKSTAAVYSSLQITWMGCCSRAQRIWGTQLTSIALKVWQIMKLLLNVKVMALSCHPQPNFLNSVYIFLMNWVLATNIYSIILHLIKNGCLFWKVLMKGREACWENMLLVALHLALCQALI